MVMLIVMLMVMMHGDHKAGMAHIIKTQLWRFKVDRYPRFDGTLDMQIELNIRM